MAHFRSIAGSGYGNPYIDSLVWGGQVWDMSTGPIKIALGGDAFDPEADYGRAVKVHGASEYLNDTKYMGSWYDGEKQLVSSVISLFESVANIKFALTTNIEDANIALWKKGFLPEGVNSVMEGPDFANSSHQRWGIFNAWMSTIWTERDPGGIGRYMMIHEMGHALGLAHPFDGGTREDRTTFPGTAQERDIGTHGLNQTMWTVMSGNTGLPEGIVSFGHQGGLGAFDIATLQSMYGANTAHASGNDVYRLPVSNAGGSGWSCIWDTGGIDTISAAGDQFYTHFPVTIDLRAATLTPNDPNAGGYISRGSQAYGGFTIAHGVVIENAIGSVANDVLIGNAAANVLNGGAGDDTYYIDSPADTIIDASGNDTVYATFNYSNPAIENVIVNGTRVVPGGTPNGETMSGSAGKDVFVGGSADDRLVGRLGNDKLTGGAGHDTFVFNTKPGRANVDKIIDYAVKDDTIELSKSIFKKISKKGVLSAKEFWTGSKAHDANDRIIYDRKKGALSYDADGSGKGDAVTFATISKNLKMAASEFIIV